MGSTISQARANKKRYFEMRRGGANLEGALFEVFGHNAKFKSEEAVAKLEEEYQQWLQDRERSPDPTIKCEEYVRLVLEGKSSRDKIWLQLYPEMRAVPADSLTSMAEAFEKTEEVQREIARQHKPQPVAPKAIAAAKGNEEALLGLLMPFP